MATLANAEETYALVQDRYGSYARQHDDENYNQKVATAFGYSAGELESVPKGANLGVSCGNPTAMAGLVNGETVIDLGCGAGFDVFLAAKKVSPDGMAIGVDMNKVAFSTSLRKAPSVYNTPSHNQLPQDMLALAQKNTLTSPYSRNITFVESSITAIPLLADKTANCIISNCVINLVPHAHKRLVFGEIWRLLQPGGRVAISDILAKKNLSQDIRSNVNLYVGCVSGASRVEQYEGWLKGVGFKDIIIVDTHSDVNAYKTSGEGIADFNGTGCCQPLNPPKSSDSATSACCMNDNSGGGQERNLGDIDLNEWVVPQIASGEQSKSAIPWFSAYPAPRSVAPQSITRFELLQWLREGREDERDFILVDLRRTDHEVSTSLMNKLRVFVRSSSVLVLTLRTTCSGSSRGRGNRAAGWFEDYISDRGDTTMKSYVLEEGINAWVRSGKEFVQMMDDYKEEVW
ncbi:MAG: hypothetical protein M1840_001530 [Geoglossum simile]|nr:MAG: hypothetical protein M1840_001530 [Geoglossum simile]